MVSAFQAGRYVSSLRPHGAEGATAGPGSVLSLSNDYLDCLGALGTFVGEERTGLSAQNGMEPCGCLTVDLAYFLVPAGAH